MSGDRLRRLLGRTDLTGSTGDGSTFRQRYVSTLSDRLAQESTTGSDLGGVLAAPSEADPAELADAYDAAATGDVVADHSVAVDTAVTAAFAELRAELEDEAAIDRVEASLSDTLDGLFESLETGVDVAGPVTAADGGTTPADGEASLDAETGTTGSDAAAEPPVPLAARELFDHVGTCLFVLDETGDVVVWNRGAEELTGVPAREAYEADMASEAFYHDGRRAKTLADKVLDAPESADEVYDVPRVDDYEFPLYRDRSTMTDADGAERHISFSAAPLYEDSEGQGPSDSRTQSGDGDLVGVVEMVQDRTADTVRRERTTDLLVELQSTIEAIQGGDYDARAAFEHEGVVDGELLSVVDALNDMAEQFQSLAGSVANDVEELREEAETVTDRSTDITTAAADQSETMTQLASEISNLSASVEEVAASASQVDATSSEAEEIAREGQASAQEAVSLLEEVEDSADDVADDVDHLQDRITEINDIVEVINDIADQTNILALNASIEAARAGEAGEGFAVVADEVKQLAEESQQNAAEIEQLIDGIQADTDETVANLTSTTERISEVNGQVEDAMARLEDIVQAISEASQGIQEVADATDDQAASTEEVASMIDEAVDQADEIAADIETIATANREQMERAREIRESVEKQRF
ncbi:methyl-accepting chemotaxis protein [Halorientalis pallida]|uniref:PAS domain-containing protein n=1 Tax=Halorientalis pallida TaxID=2479928 RepID=A0A498L385_9EURY|nr:methyl-accepting chemotaxis protein [Halorientalis pallida]RXK50244.1 PAS domain-containing protein [Halorientalis pallida]